MKGPIYPWARPCATSLLTADAHRSSYAGRSSAHAILNHHAPLPAPTTAAAATACHHLEQLQAEHDGTHGEEGHDAQQGTASSCGGQIRPQRSSSRPRADLTGLPSPRVAREEGGRQGQWRMRIRGGEEGRGRMDAVVEGAGRGPRPPPAERVGRGATAGQLAGGGRRREEEGGADRGRWSSRPARHASASPLLPRASEGGGRARRRQREQGGARAVARRRRRRRKEEDGADRGRRSSRPTRRAAAPACRQGRGPRPPPAEEAARWWRGSLAGAAKRRSAPGGSSEAAPCARPCRRSGGRQPSAVRRAQSLAQG